MAKILPKIPILNEALGYVPSSGVETGVNIGSKLLRAKIELWDRRFRGFERIDVNGPRDAYEYETVGRGDRGNKEHRTQITKGDPERNSGIMVSPNAGQSSRTATNDYFEKNPDLKDYIAIIDYDYKPTAENTTPTEGNNESKPKLSNRRYRELRIPFVPRELQVNPESNFVGISSFGRNNPFYQFTGSEDTLTFEIDWLATESSREDVITKCRWIEALTKGDGYEDVPHRIILMWGANNKLFKDHKWIITSAPYRLMNFNRGYMEDNKFISTHLLPNRAIQTITLKRVTDTNLSSAQIIGNLNMK